MKLKIVKILDEWKTYEFEDSDIGCRWINALCDDGSERAASACTFAGVHYPTAEAFIERNR